MSMIDDIYNGEYYPSELVKPGSEAFRAHAAQAERLSAQLAALLDEEQRDVLDAYKSETAVVTDLYNLEFYRAGIQFGIRLLTEALFGCVEPPDLHK